MKKDLIKLMRENKTFFLYSDNNKITTPITGYAVFYNPTLCVTPEEIDKEVKKRNGDWGILIGEHICFVTNAFWDIDREEVVKVTEDFTCATAIYNCETGHWEGL